MQAHMTEEARLTRMETVVEHIQYILEKMDKRLDEMEGKLNHKFDRMEQRINQVNQRLDSSTRWLVGIGVTSLLSVFAAIINMALKIH